jgi:hypothetical protein
MMTLYVCELEHAEREKVDERERDDAAGQL